MKLQALPDDLHVERIILGAAMSDPDSWIQIRDGLDPSDFALEKHRRIFSRMKDLSARGESVDRVSVAHELMTQGQLESVNGLEGLMELDEDMPAVANIEQYIRIVQDAAIRRRAVLGCQAVLNEAMSRSARSPEVVQRLAKLTADLEGCLVDGSDMQNPEQIILASSVSALFGDGESKVLSTPWSRLNGLIGGFEPGQLVIVGGRPGTGKSVFLYQCAVSAAQMGKKVGLFSLEMTSVSLIQRYIAMRASIPLHRLRGGRMDAPERERARDALDGMTRLHKFLHADRIHTISGMRANLSRSAAKAHFDLIVVDYLQLLAGGSGRQSLLEEITAISRALKVMAGEFQCPVLVASQLSRESEKESREPRLSDLRQCGSLEQDADTVIFPHATRVQDPDSTDMSVEFIVAKQRNGRVGRVPAVFEKPFVRFSER